MVTLRCDEAPRLKLGPGTQHGWPGTAGSGWPGQPGYVPPSDPTPPGDVIVFQPLAPDPPGELAPGYASFDGADFPLWREWVGATGTPHIFVIDESTGLPINEAEELHQTMTALPRQENPRRAVPAPAAPPAKKERTAAQIAATAKMLAAAKPKAKAK